MISVLFNWLYIFIVTFLIGLGFFKLLSVFLKRQLSFSFFFADTMRCRCHNRVRAASQSLL